MKQSKMTLEILEVLCEREKEYRKVEIYCKMGLIETAAIIKKTFKLSPRFDF